MAVGSEGAGAAPQGMRPLQRINAILGGSAGNMVEWYDWFAYSSFALYFAKHFFPKGDSTAQLLQAAAVFAVGFLARPIGAWLMGLYADWAGRRAALTASVSLMSLGSFAIAILPTYQQIGQFAAIGLVVARLVQGLSLGGEYGASATYMSEMAGAKHRGFWSSFQYLTLILGQLTALAVLIVLQKTLSVAALESWGWRVPFAIGGVLAIVVFWIRSGLHESREYLRAKEAGEKGGTLRLLREHPKEFLAILGLTAAGSLSFYAYTTYMQKFLVNTSGFSKDAATAISAGALVIYMFIQPLSGWISDYAGRKNMIAGSFILGAIFTYPVFSAIAVTRSPLLAFALTTFLVVIVSGYSACNAAVKSELFPAHVRALGVALPYALANTIFGGTAEYVALWFKAEGAESGFYVYVAVVMAISAVIALRLRNTNVTSLIQDD